ncbi:MAG: cytochrome C [Desulfuromonas sp.]|nr:MAG: cytochrome C [Desulfuromonas sp.]
MRRKFSTRHALRLVKLLPLFLVLAACATGTIREKLLTLPIIDGATYVGQETCAGCHEEKATALVLNVHGRLSDTELMGAHRGCEACHGPGSLHVDGDGDTDKILQPSALRADEAAAICAKCHTDGKMMDWTHSAHALADVSCTDCHTMHGEESAPGYLKKSDPELCYSCHQEEQAKASFPSHHPVKEGKMNCSSCHNPHGELNTEEQARDLCLDCHARYQGPFVFEHAPVEEDCTICHDPHGTVANNLLQQNEPFLCLQCHESHFHTTRISGTTPATNVAFSSTDANGAPITSFSGTPGDGTNTTIPITNDMNLTGNAWQMGFGTKCTVCHSVVHGSDLPSQSAPTTNVGETQGWPDGGTGLTR